MEMRGIDPRTSRMLSERSTIWATSPYISEPIMFQKARDYEQVRVFLLFKVYYDMAHRSQLKC
jgi:hypothetical protein